MTFSRILTTLITVTLVEFQNFGVNYGQVLAINPAHPLCSGKAFDLCTIQGDPHFCTFDNVMHHYQAPQQAPFYYIDGFTASDNRLCTNGANFPCTPAPKGLPFEVIGVHKSCLGPRSCLDHFVIRLYNENGIIYRQFKLEVPSPTRTVMSIFDGANNFIEGRDSDNDFNPNLNGPINIFQFGNYNCDRVTRAGNVNDVYIRCRFEWTQINTIPTSHNNYDNTCGQCNNADLIVELEYSSTIANSGRIWLTDALAGRGFGLCGSNDGVQETSANAILQRVAGVGVRRLVDVDDKNDDIDENRNDKENGGDRKLLQAPPEPYIALNWCDMQQWGTIDNGGWQKTTNFGNSWIADNRTLPITPIGPLPDRDCIRRAIWHCSNIWNNPSISSCLTCENDILILRRPFGLNFDTWLQDCIFDSCAEADKIGANLDNMGLNDALNAGIFTTSIAECGTFCLPQVCL